MISAGQKLMIGVSGGSDSIALLHLLHQLKPKLALSLLAVHINHNLRGAESAEDELFVKHLCDRLNIPIVIRQLHFESKADLENAARLGRREIMLQLKNMYKFDRIVLAHQKDDQAETVLMNMVRGAGITGLGGIPPISGIYLRPLFAFSKAELESWLTASGFTWRQDSSNADNSFTRNHIRNELIPWIAQNLNPEIIHRLYQQANSFRKTDDWLKTLCAKKLKKLIIDDSADQVVLDLKGLIKLSEIEQFYILRSCYSTLARTDHEFFMHSFEEIRRLYNATGSKTTRLAHKIYVIRQYQELILTTTQPKITEQSYQEMIVDIDKAHFVFMNWRFTLRFLKIKPKDLMDSETHFHLLLDANALTLPLKLRSRKAGDRFHPYGMQHSKKLKEFFIDEKVPLFDRDKVPLLTDADKILWIIGLRKAAATVCGEDTHRILHITAEPVSTGRKRAANRANNNSGGKNEFYE